MIHHYSHMYSINDNISIDTTWIIMDCISYNKIQFYNILNDFKKLKKLTHIEFNYMFNEKLNNLPNITHLYVGSNYNHALNNLPNTLTHLILGDKFNKSLSNLPNSITHLCLGRNYNKKIPTKLNNIKLFIHVSNLPFLSYETEFINIIIEKKNFNNDLILPINLKKIIFIDVLNYLSHSYIKLPFNCDFESKTTFDSNCNLCTFDVFY